MDTSKILKWAIFMLILVLHPHIEDPLVATVPIPPFAPRPLCNFQLALANQACAYLPSWRLPSSPPPPPPPFPPVYPTSPPPEHHEHHKHRHGRSHMHEHAPDEEAHEHVPDEQANNQTHGHGHGHHRHDHDHHKHGHSHHKHRMSPVEQQCCKWLAQVDDECVCEMLSRLPPFLARPVHEYTVRVAGSCNTTYSCGPQLRM